MAGSRFDRCLFGVSSEHYERCGRLSQSKPQENTGYL
jgi:hypothetical protein